MKRKDTFDRVHKSINSKQKLKLKNHIHFTSLAHSPLQLSESWEAPRLVVDVVTETRCRAAAAAAQQQPTSAQRWDNTADCRLGATMFSVEAPALAFFLGQLDEAEISRENERFDQVDDYISNFGFAAVIHQDNTKRQGI